MKILHRLRFFVGSSPVFRLELSLVISILAVFCFELSLARAEQARLAREVIRLHVVADSDSAADQALKLSVRDRILAEYSSRLTETATAGEAEELVRGELETIARIAEEELLSRGCEDRVTVTVAKENFPQRSYGEVVLPAGEYTALRVVIGSGRGQNWWCVMFPPLCSFGEDTCEVPLGAEWDIATSDGPEVKFKLRLLEIFSRLKKPSK
ncbi:MAG: stage II sporulation protein R [Clostridia bacterium]|nr:stage II sporulation protein R [Clostridia bacterium]